MAETTPVSLPGPTPTYVPSTTDYKLGNNYVRVNLGNVEWTSVHSYSGT